MPKFPEFNRFPLKEISARWTRLRKQKITPADLVRMADEGLIEIVDSFGTRPLTLKHRLAQGSRKPLDPSDYWMTREERYRFEALYFPPESEDVLPPAEHISPKLATLTQAAKEFWSSADRHEPDTHPKNVEVSRWLLDHGFGDRQAEEGARIIRPEWARKGRPAKE
jgi:hypothetical protein